MQLAIKDMRLPGTADDDNGNDIAAENADDESLFEVCLARRISPNNSKDEEENDNDKINSNHDNNDPWAGYTRLETVPRRQLRILQPGDRICTRAPLAMDNENDDDENEEEDFSGIGLVLEYRLQVLPLGRSSSSPGDDVKMDCDEPKSPMSSADIPLDTQMTVLEDDNDSSNSKEKSKTSPKLKILDSPTSSTQGDDATLTQPQPSMEALGQTMESGDSSEATTKGEDSVSEKASPGKDEGDDNDDTNMEEEETAPPAAVELLVTQPTDEDDNKGGDSDSETTIGEEDGEDKMQITKDESTETTKSEAMEDNNAAEGGEKKDQDPESDSKNALAAPTTETTKSVETEDTKNKKANKMSEEKEESDDDDATTVGSAGDNADDVAGKEPDQKEKGVDVNSHETVVEPSAKEVTTAAPKDDNKAGKGEKEKQNIPTEEVEDNDDAIQGPAIEMEGDNDDADATQGQATENENSNMKDPAEVSSEQEASNEAEADSSVTGAKKNHAEAVKASESTEEAKSEQQSIPFLSQDSLTSPKRKYKTYSSKHKSPKASPVEDDETEKCKSALPKPEEKPSSAGKPAAAGRRSKRKKPAEADQEGAEYGSAEQYSTADAKDKDFEEEDAPDDIVMEEEAPFTPNEKPENVDGMESSQRRKGARILAGLKDEEEELSPSMAAKEKKSKQNKGKPAKPATRVNRGKKRAIDNLEPLPEEDFDVVVPTNDVKPRLSVSPTSSVASDPAAEGRKQRSKKARGQNTDLAATPPPAEKLPEETPARSIRKRKTASKASEQLKGKRARARTPATTEDKDADDGGGDEIRIMTTGVALSKAQLNVSECFII